MLHPWGLLTVTILFEVAGTISMKLSEGFAKGVPSILIFVFYGLSFTFLTLTLKTWNVSTVYAIWSGLGTSLVAVIGVAYFKETMNAPKALDIGLVGTRSQGTYLCHTSSVGGMCRIHS